MDNSPLEPSLEPDRIPNDSCSRGSVPMRRKQPPPPQSRPSSGGRTSKASIRSNGSRLSTSLKPLPAVNASTSGSTINQTIRSSSQSIASNKPVLR